MPHIFRAASACLLAAALCAPACAGALFRYRSFTGTRPAAVSPLTAAGNISHTALPAGDVLVVNRGASFKDWTATDFDGSTEFVGGSSAITTLNSSDDSFSIEAIFYPRSANGQVKLVSNTESSRGFCLRLMDGHLSGLVRLKNGSKSVDLHVIQDTSAPLVPLNAWHRGVFTVTRKAGAGRYEGKLYLDGQLVAENSSTSLYDGVYQSPEPPMVGAEPTAGAGTMHFFDGFIHLGVIRQGTLPPEYLSIDGPRDGSPNMGFPDSPESVGGTALEATDKFNNTMDRLSNWGNICVGNVPCAMYNDDYVPQGCATDGVANFYISMYWQLNGKTGNYPSILAQVGFDGRLKHVIQLLKRDGTEITAHVGGCGYYNGKVYVAVNTAIFRFDMNDLPKPGYIPDGNQITNIRGDQNALKADGRYDPNLMGNTQNSFLETGPGPGGKPYLWVGQWDTDQQRRLLGFPIDANGNIPDTPTYNFKLWRTGLQGVACYRATASEISFYGSSNPGGDGTIFAADYPLQATAETTLRAVRTIGRGPKGIEDLTVLNGNPWTVNETPSYNTADFYPFIYGMKGETSAIKDPFRYDP